MMVFINMYPSNAICMEYHVLSLTTEYAIPVSQIKINATMTYTKSVGPMLECRR
jgi:hypothetical protein